MPSSTPAVYVCRVLKCSLKVIFPPILTAELSSRCRLRDGTPQRSSALIMNDPSITETQAILYLPFCLI